MILTIRSDVKHEKSCANFEISKDPAASIYVIRTYIRLVSAIEIKRNNDQTSHYNQTRIHPGKLVKAKWNNQIKNLQSSTRSFLLSTMISTPEQAVIGGGSVDAWIGLLECCDAAVKCPTLLCNLMYTVVVHSRGDEKIIDKISGGQGLSWN